MKIIGRILNYCSYLLLSWPAALLIRTDLILALTDPPLAGLIAAIAARSKRKPFIYYIQDLHPDMAIAAGMIQAGLMSRIWEKIHYWVMSQADEVIVLGEDMQCRLAEKGIDITKTVVIRHGTQPYKKNDNLNTSIIEELRCGFEFAIIHAGNIGHYGAWNTLIKAAAMIKNSQAGIIFIGEGAAKSELINLVDGNDKIKILPFRPRSEFVNVLAAGDMHVVTIRHGLEGTLVPSKLYPILSSGKPVLAVVPSTSDVAKIVSKFKCGEIVDPDRPDVLAEVILSLSRDPDRLGEMGQRSRFAAEQLSQRGEIKKLIDIVESYTG